MKLIKQYKRTLIITSLMLLIPVIVGLLLWDQLPDPMPSHWDIHGEVDGWSSKTTTVFGFPALMLALQWVCLFACTADPKRANYNPKMLKMSLWVCPCIGLILCTMVYSAALGREVPIERIMPVIFGVMFIVIGNWLPKCQQTYTMGIKLPWTLASEENWNATHRFGGKVWFFGGIFSILSAFIGNFRILIAILAAMVILPTVYSYRYYLKHEKEDHHDN